MPRRRGPSFDRAQVVQAAIGILEQGGAEPLTLSAVARSMGIQPPSLYNHVRSADDLALAVSLEGALRHLTALEASIHQVYEPREVLLTLALAARTWVLAHPAIYAVMSGTPPQNDDPEHGPVIARTLDLFRRPLGQLGIEGDAAIHAIRALRAGIHGFVQLEAAGQFQLGQDTEESFRWLIEAILRGLPAR